MPRPRKCCRVSSMPGVTYFKPAGVPLRFLAEECLSVEEIEAVRLRDVEGLDQEQCADRMNVSRPTFQRLLKSARGKIARSLLGGKALRIEGGNFKLESSDLGSHLEDIKDDIEDYKIYENRRKDTMKIAVVTDDEKTISQHFGRATLYVVYSVENGQITGKETRPKMGHSHFAAAEGGHAHQGGHHGFDPASQQRHASMAEAIKDSQVLIAGGMGTGAFESMKSYKIEPVITDVRDSDEAVKLYIQGKLPNLINRLH